MLFLVVIDLRWGPYNLWALRYFRSTDGQIAMDSIQGLFSQCIYRPKYLYAVCKCQKLSSNVFNYLFILHTEIILVISLLDLSKGQSQRDEVDKGSGTLISKGYHLAKCHSMTLGQVPFTKIRNLAGSGTLVFLS